MFTRFLPSLFTFFTHVLVFISACQCFYIKMSLLSNLAYYWLVASLAILWVRKVCLDLLRQKGNSLHLCLNQHMMWFKFPLPNDLTPHQLHISLMYCSVFVKPCPLLCDQIKSETVLKCLVTIPCPHISFNSGLLRTNC